MEIGQGFEDVLCGELVNTLLTTDVGTLINFLTT